MGRMVRRAKWIVKHNRFSVLFAKGYHKGKELAAVQKLGIKTLVAIPAFPSSGQDQILPTMLRTSFIILIMIPSNALKGTFYTAQKDGIKPKVIDLNITKLLHLAIVLLKSNVPNRETEKSFTAVNTSNQSSKTKLAYQMNPKLINYGKS
ncbi:hypothetical protein [Xanthovirga aplysinae]|uniref:hypothetical protein n=1 Tax=Xanthovirga aplysinae TaxID=2529853 RepID=UPI0012BBD733|nr:hypothetical protein [Xanthovirga aplysinae]MTI29670.1 hypothetical protein [Xanthovirga aplysinae]